MQTKYFSIAVFILFLTSSFAQANSSQFFLKSDVDRMEKSAINMAFYRKIITDKNCNQSEQKFAGCLQSIYTLMNAALGYAPVVVKENEEELAEARAQANLLSAEKAMLTILGFDAQSEVKFDSTKTKPVVNSGLLKFAEVFPKKPNSNADSLIQGADSNQKAKSIENYVVDQIQKMRGNFNRLYLESLKANNTSFEAILDFIEKKTTKPALNIIIYNAVNTYLSVAIDPHTSIQLQKASVKMLDRNSFDNQGFGIAFAPSSAEKNIGFRIMEVYRNSPASKNGLKKGDLIVWINGETLDVNNLEKFYKFIMKKESKKLVLKVVRDQIEQPSELEIQKDSYTVENVESDMLSFSGQTIGYAKLRSFSTRLIEPNGTSPLSDQVPFADCFQLNKAFEKFQESTHGAILDLRNNQGGSLDNVICIAGLFLGPKEVALYSKSLNPQFLPEEAASTFIFPQPKEPPLIRYLTSATAKKVFAKPLVLLINEMSASSSELLAAALRDHNVAFIIGNQSFGKGTVGTVGIGFTKEPNLPVPADSKDPYAHIPESRMVVSGTTSSFFSPKGTSHHGQGVKPHVLVYKEPTASPAETIKMREADKFLYPLSIERLNLQGIDLSKMDRVMAHHGCLGDAKLVQVYNGLINSDPLKDMQILTGLQQIKCFYDFVQSQQRRTN